MVKVLVVEDEASIREMIALNLRLAGMEAVEADSAEAALPLLEQRPGCQPAQNQGRRQQRRREARLQVRLRVQAAQHLVKAAEPKLALLQISGSHSRGHISRAEPLIFVLREQSKFQAHAHHPTHSFS